MKRRVNMNRTWLGIVVVCVVCLTGCGQVANETVSGEVTLDGKPVPEGTITFVSVKHAGQRHEGQIRDGQFSLMAAVGENRVRISAPKPVEEKKTEGANPGQTDPGAELEESIPARYNRQSELTREVEPGGENEFQFDLKSSPD